MRDNGLKGQVGGVVSLAQEPKHRGGVGLWGGLRAQ